MEFNFVGSGSHELSQTNKHALRQNEKSNTEGNTNVECYPLISILLAVGKTKIDFLSLGKKLEKKISQQPERIFLFLIS